jgi:hypothetical protein
MNSRLPSRAGYSPAACEAISRAAMSVHKQYEVQQYEVPLDRILQIP